VLPAHIRACICARSGGDALDEDAYKAEKEAFVSGLAGSSAWEVALLMTVMPLSALLRRALAAAAPELQGSRAAAFAADLACLVLPAILSLCSDSGALLAPPTLLTLVWLCVEARRARRPQGPAALGWNAPEQRAALCSHQRLPFVTEFRAAVTLSTCVAILAVDFRAFPRRFAKTETMGVSVMDMGVGSVIFSAALTASSARGGRGRDTLLRALPLVVLGGARFVAVRAANYQEHVSEYGVHWNFFLTLATLMTLAQLVAPLSARVRAALGLALAVAYQAALSLLGGAEYLLNAPRVDLLSANREGLLGTLGGFFPLWLLAGATGEELLRLHVPAPPSLAAWRSRVLRLAQVAALTLCSAAAAHALAAPVSRRQANLAFVLWALGLNQLLLALFAGVDLLSARPQPAPLAERTSRHQLATFLLANALTGAVNLAMRTLRASDGVARLVVTVYMLLVCGLGAILWRP
jgi:phosphatidylinositol glycan class W